MADERFCFEVWQGDLRVVEGEAPTEDEAQREGMHYAMMYAKDGPVLYRFGRHPLPKHKPGA